MGTALIYLLVVVAVAAAVFGLAGLAQVNLGVRKHRNRSLLQLGAMARQILGAALRRCAGGGPSDSGVPVTQFVQVGGEWLPSSTELEVIERPPMRELLGDPLH